MHLFKKGISLILSFYCGITSASSWTVSAAPYLWAIKMNGIVQQGNAQVHISQSFIDIMKHFQGGGMLWLDAHKDKFGLFFNALYSVLEDNQSIRNIPISAHNNFGIFSAGASYELFEKSFFNDEQQWRLELFSGARFTLNRTTLKIAYIPVASNKQWTDPIIGLRSTYEFNKQWQTIIAADVGGINQHNSYDIQGYLGYTPKKQHIFEHSIFYLGYRFLHQYLSTGYATNLYVWNMDISGPVLGMKAIF